MKTVLKNWFIFSVFSLILISCGGLRQGLNNGNRTIIGSKNIMQKFVPMEPFHAIQIDGYNVTLVQDTMYQVRISGEDNIIPEILFTNTDGILTSSITESVRLRPKRKPTIFVHFIDIDQLVAEDARYVSLGSITTDSLLVFSNTSSFNIEVNVNQLRVDLSGTGIDRGFVAATGNVELCNVVLERNGAFDSPKLTGENCQIIYQDGSLYRIKLKNWEETNVKLPSNRLQNIGRILMNLLVF